MIFTTAVIEDPVQKLQRHRRNYLSLKILAVCLSSLMEKGIYLVNPDENCDMDNLKAGGALHGSVTTDNVAVWRCCAPSLVYASKIMG